MKKTYTVMAATAFVGALVTACGKFQQHQEKPQTPQPQP